MASEAEARIRTKAEALLRSHWPDARIIHEFDLGGVRLDIAAVTDDRLILLEIKSELDTLTRLERQVRGGFHIGGPVIVCYAAKWHEPIRALSFEGRWRAEWVRESDGPLALPYPRRIDPVHDKWNSRALLGLLLKPELFALAKPHGAKAKHTVPDLQTVAHENLTGREIRRGVMAALRARRFGWTCDAPAEITA